MKLSIISILGFAVMSVSHAATFSVDGPNELRAAFQSARGGDTINLRAGNYGDVTLNAMKASYLMYSSEVRLQSATPSNPAVFSSIYLNGVRNLSFIDIAVRGVALDDRYRTVHIRNSVRLSFIRGRYEGRVSGGLGRAIGFHATGTQFLRIEDVVVSSFKMGISLHLTQDTTILSSRIENIVSNSIFVNHFKNLRIDSNYIESIYDAGGDRHQDLIQLGYSSQASTAPDTATIVNNDLFTNDDKTHGIFISNSVAQKSNKASDFFRNVTITGNTVTLGGVHGISVDRAVGVTVRGNTIRKPSQIFGDRNRVPRIRVGTQSQNVLAEGNSGYAQPTAAIPERDWEPVATPRNGWSIRDNSLVPLPR